MTILTASTDFSARRLSHERDVRGAIFYAKSDVALDDGELRALHDSAPRIAESRNAQATRIAVEAGFGGIAAVHAIGTYHVVHRIDRLSDPPIVVRSTLPNLFVEDRSLLLDGWAAHWLGGSLAPAGLGVQFATQGAPFDYALLDFAKGHSLRDLGDAVLDDKPNLPAVIGAALKRVHRVEAKGAGLLDLDSPRASERPTGAHRHWIDYVELRLSEHLAACTNAGYLNATLAIEISELFATMRGALHNRPLRLLHGDPGNHNIFLSSDLQGVTALVDWEDALAGDPLFDVAMWSTFHPPRRLPAFLSGYGLPRPNIEQQRLIALYFLRIALSKTVHRHRFGIADVPGRALAHLRIHHGASELRRLLEA